VVGLKELESLTSSTRGWYLSVLTLRFFGRGERVDLRFELAKPIKNRVKSWRFAEEHDLHVCVVALQMPELLIIVGQ
jgi:hypothetical protein